MPPQEDVVDETLRQLFSAEKPSTSAILGVLEHEDSRLNPISLDYALVMAAQIGDLQIVKEAIKQGADVNASESHGNTALIYAAKNGHTQIVQALILASADVNLENTNGGTALGFATTHAIEHHQLQDSNPTIPLIEILCAAGADPEIPPNNEHNPKSKVDELEKKRPEKAKQITQAFYENTAYREKEQFELTISLIKNGQMHLLDKSLGQKNLKNFINKQDAQGNTLLHHAAKKYKGDTSDENLAIIEKLVKAGAKTAQTANKEGKTPHSIINDHWGFTHTKNREKGINTLLRLPLNTPLEQSSRVKVSPPVFLPLQSNGKDPKTVATISAGGQAALEALKTHVQKLDITIASTPHAPNSVTFSPKGEENHIKFEAEVTKGDKITYRMTPGNAGSAPHVQPEMTNAYACLAKAVLASYDANSPKNVAGKICSIDLGPNVKDGQENALIAAIKTAAEAKKPPIPLSAIELKGSNGKPIELEPPVLSVKSSVTPGGHKPGS